MPAIVPEQCREELKSALGSRYQGEYKGCVLELVTRLQSHDPHDLIYEAAANRHWANSILDRYDLRSLALACHPTALALELPARQSALSTAEDQRYRRIERFKGDAVRNLAVNGVHMHVGTYESIERHNALPILMHLAPLHSGLTACSPYFGGRDTGQESWRLRVLMTLSSTLPVLDDTVEAQQELVQLLSEAGGPADESEHWGLIRCGANKPTIEFRAADTAPELDVLIGLAALSASAAYAARKGWLKRPQCSEQRCLSIYQYNFEAVAAFGAGATLADPFDSRPKLVSEYAAAWVTRCERAIDALNLGDTIAEFMTLVARGHPGQKIRLLMTETFDDARAQGFSSTAATSRAVQRVVKWAWEQADASPTKAWIARMRDAA
jgi:gamma-glutamyl:cysteine ligase YbdK (ATP-grasp superfamily)